MTDGNLVSAVCNRIKFDIDKIKSDSVEKIEVESFNLSDFWTQFGSSVQALSNEVTKLGFMCGKKPFPKFSEVSSMLEDLMQYYNVMRDLYLVLPEEVGAVVYNGVRSAILNILAAVLNIVRSLEDLSEKGAKERLVLTGTFWDACNAVDSLPRDNLHAALKVIDEECALAVDAQEELTTVNESGNESDHEIPASTQNCEAEIDPKTTIEGEKLEHLKNSKELNTVLLDLKFESPSHVVETNNQTHAISNSKIIVDLNKKRDMSETLQVSPNKIEYQTSSLTKNTITEIHYNKLKEWVCTLRAWNKNPSLLTLECELNGIKDLLQRLESNSNDPIFKDLTKNQKEDKDRQLKTKLEELLDLKQIVDSDPEILEKVTLGSVVSDSNFSKTNDEKESNIPTQQKSSVSVYEKSDLPFVLSKEIINELETSIFINPISVADYMEIKSWIDQQTANNKPANSDTVQLEIAALSSRFQNLISSGTPTLSSAGKKNRKAKRAKLLRKLKRLILIKHVFDLYPSQFISPITNDPISYGSPQPIGNQILKSIKNSFLARNQVGYSHVIKNTSIFMEKITNGQSILPDQSLNISYNVDYSCTSNETFYSGKNLNNTNKRKLNFESNPLQDEIRMPPQKQLFNEKNFENSKYSSNAKSFLLSETRAMLPNYDTEFKRRTYTNNIDSLGGLLPVSGLFTVNERLKEIHMFLPLPNGHGSGELMNYFAKIHSSDVLKNIEKHNYGLCTDRWKVYREWRDEFKCYNILLGVDENSLKILEAQDYKARFNSYYYAFFKKSFSERRPVNDVSTSVSNHYSNQVLSFDYQHGRK